MALKIRLRQQGRHNYHTFRLVVANVRSPRDGKYIESLGWYNPKAADEKKLEVDASRLEHWLNTGAELSESLVSLLEPVVPDVLKRLTQKGLEKRKKASQKRRTYRKKAA